MEFLTNLTLGKKITVLTTLGLLVGVGVFSFFSMQAVNRATEAMLQDRLTTATLVADYLDEALERALAELQSVAQTIQATGERGRIEANVALLEDSFSRLSIRTHGIFLIDTEGKITWSQTKYPDMAKVNIASYPAFDQAINRTRANVSGLVSAPITSTPVILLTSPTIQEPGGSRGVLVVAVDLAQSSIGGFIQPIRLGQTGYVEIVDQNGMVVARTQPGPSLSPFEKSDHSGRFAALIDAAEPARGVCHTCHEPGKKVEKRDVLAFVPLSSARWGVVIRQSQEEALAPTRELRQNLLLFGVGLVTIALVFVGVTTRNIGGRIRALTSASRRIAEGDLFTPISTPGRDEVGMLGETLDDMRHKLMTSYSELEQKTRELSSLLSVSEILTSARDLPSLLNSVVAKAVEIIPGSDGGALLLQTPNQGSLALQCAIGLEKAALEQLTATANNQSDTGVRDVVIEHVIGSLQSDVLRSRVKSYIQAGVSQANHRVGNLILVSFRDNQAFTASDRRLLDTVADYIAIAIERSQLIKEAEEARALHEIERLRSQLISSVSHELRTPLTLIKGYSTSLLRQDVLWDRETQREFLQGIEEKTDELRDLIDKLLQSAKLEAGAIKLEREPVLMPRLVQKVVEELAPRARKHQFVIKFPPSFPVVEADLRCMEQVVRNLMENATKYSPEGSEIIIAGDVKSKQVVISVADKGVGIPREHQDKIFERFYRIDSASTHGIPGSGLGLFITKGHVEAHGGRVWVESAAGKGSTFYFSLPVETAEERKQALEST